MVNPNVCQHCNYRPWATELSTRTSHGSVRLCISCGETFLKAREFGAKFFHSVMKSVFGV